MARPAFFRRGGGLRRFAVDPPQPGRHDRGIAVAPAPFRASPPADPIAMPERSFKSLLRRRNAGAALRREVVLQALARPRTQTELQTRLGMSRTGTLHLLRRMERDGLVRAAERVGVTRIWEKAPGEG